MNYIPRQRTRSAKYTPQDPEVRGVCGFLTRVRENSRFEITMSNNHKMLICGTKITSDTVYPALKYNLPKNYDLLSMACLCAFHQDIFNKALFYRWLTQKNKEFVAAYDGSLACYGLPGASERDPPPPDDQLVSGDGLAG